MTFQTGEQDHSNQEIHSEIHTELIRLCSDHSAQTIALLYLRDNTLTPIDFAGEDISTEIARLEQLITKIGAPEVQETENSSNTFIYLCKVDIRHQYFLYAKYYRKIFSRRIDSKGPTLSGIRRLTFEFALSQTKREHEIVTTSITQLLGGYLDSDLFKHTLKSLLALSGCSGGSIWEYHDNSEYNDASFLTLEATDGHNPSDYDENCLASGEGLVWDALKPNVPKIQHIENINISRVVNKRLSSIYKNKPLLLFRLEACDRIFGVACLYGVSHFDMTLMDTTFEAFERLAALAISNKRLELKASLLAGLRAIIPHSEKRTSENICAIAAKKIRTLLNCQAVSIFLKEDLLPDSLSLRLTGVDWQRTLAPSEATAAYIQLGTPVQYNLNEQALTTAVVREPRIIVSNRVSKSSINSHRYREIIDSINDTWIGVPIVNSDRQAIGLIRCTGKTTTIEKNVLRYIFDHNDIHVLTYYAEILSRVLETITSTNRLESLNKKLALAEEIRAHEMYAPLLSIAGNARWIRAYLSEPAATSKSRRLDDIMTDAEMCSFLLREASLPSPEDMRREGRVVSINNMLVKMKDFLMRRIFAKSPRKRGDGSYDDFSADYDRLPVMHVLLHGHAPRTFVHPILLQRALYNIASNAVKYGHRDGYLKITAFPDAADRVIYIDFEDDGIGIEPQDREIIFLEGIRGSNVPSDKYPGSGLGLHIAREVIRRHGGSLTLLSLRNPTKFRVLLPWRENAP